MTGCAAVGGALTQHSAGAAAEQSKRQGHARCQHNRTSQHAYLPVSRNRSSAKHSTCSMHTNYVTLVARWGGIHWNLQILLCHLLLCMMRCLLLSCSTQALHTAQLLASHTLLLALTFHPLRSSRGMGCVALSPDTLSLPHAYSCGPVATQKVLVPPAPHCSQRQWHKQAQLKSQQQETDALKHASG
jgi:hypothetical protein